MRKLIRQQDGIAMPLAMSMLLMVSLMAASVSTTSITVGQAANTDRLSKRALAAAETGLQVANLRLNNAPTLTGTQCLVGAPAGIECPTYGSGDLGSGTSYRFWVSQQLAAGDACGKLPSQTQTGRERCITATGIANGVERRVQTRVLDLAASTSLVPVPGVFALSRLEFRNDSTIAGRVGSNGVVAALNTLTVEGVDLGPTGSLSASGPVTYTEPPAVPVTYSPDKTLSAVPVGNSATVNNNSSILSGGGVTYAAATRSLTLNGATLTLTQSGDYNFCQLVVNNSSSIQLAAGVKANIFIDAPDAVRPGSGCPSGNGWGELTAQNNLTINSPGVADDFKLFVVGWDSGSSYAAANGPAYLDFQNQLNINGLLYAPNATVDFKNDSIVAGAVAANRITFHNKGTVNYGAGAASFGDPSLHYMVQGWRECRPKVLTAGDPESGC
jgi:Tfp pilus assembly protein PilX